jgi:hypothetical protein
VGGTEEQHIQRMKGRRSDQCSGEVRRQYDRSAYEEREGKWENRDDNNNVLIR